ncbi:hypothetical protein U879_06595 [Defluviimonas sp. 20V17]|uniref:Uncharacterized protein n=1 Tax=Allgaiera indica TaxID=765699 RepID=A0AAN5A1E8_9RHOB|nr:hypothetical protein U879_06595 [Defluviimonas sp. 20V17]GHE06216.1 hypothetical protein GCM10008024_39880 [Allgaiera indica]
MIDLEVFDGYAPPENPLQLVEQVRDVPLAVAKVRQRAPEGLLTPDAERLVESVAGVFHDQFIRQDEKTFPEACHDLGVVDLMQRGGFDDTVPLAAGDELAFGRTPG